MLSPTYNYRLISQKKALKSKMKRKFQDFDEKNFDSLYSFLIEYIIDLALSDLKDFTKTWCTIRAVNKRWNAMVDLSKLK